jgi:hypothetical protein
MKQQPCSASEWRAHQGCPNPKPKGNDGSKGLSTPSPKGEIIEPSAQALGKGNNKFKPRRGDTKAANHVPSQFAANPSHISLFLLHCLALYRLTLP